MVGIYMRNNNNNIRYKLSSKLKINQKYLKFLIPVGAFLFLLVAFLGSRIIPAMLANNVYNMSDLDGNLGNVKEGDIISYEINGYNKWRILSVDKENGTVEVTSDSNVYDLTIEPGKTVDEYNAIFQSEADKFNDDRYVVNTRTIAKSDSLMFDTKGEYWLANVNENSLMTNKTGGQDTAQIPIKSLYSDFGPLYFAPYFSIITPENVVPPEGYVLNVQYNGVDHWNYKFKDSITSGGVKKNRLYFIASNFVTLDISDCSTKEEVNNKIYSLKNSFNSSQFQSNILSSGDAYLSNGTDCWIDFYYGYSFSKYAKDFDFNGRDYVNMPSVWGIYVVV